MRVGKGAGEHVGRVLRHVEPDLVEHLEGAHRHAELAHRLRRSRAGVAVLEQVHGLAQVRHQDAVHDEAGRVLHHHRRLAEPAREGHGGDDRGVGGLAPAHHLHQRHAVDGVEEVEAAEALGAREARRRAR
jgi:hypothetical protein